MPSVAASVSSADSWGDLGHDWLNTIASALSIESIESVVHVSQETLLCIASVTKDSAFAAMGLTATVLALRRCLNGSFFSVDAIVALSSGLNAACALDRVAAAGIGISVGIGSFGVVTGGLVNVVTLVNRVRQGDAPGSLLSGAKLIATIALTGHPVALGIVIAADVTYGLYCMYSAYAESNSASEPQQKANEDAYPGPLDEVLASMFKDMTAPLAEG